MSVLVPVVAVGALLLDPFTWAGALIIGFAAKKVGVALAWAAALGIGLDLFVRALDKTYDSELLVLRIVAAAVATMVVFGFAKLRRRRTQQQISSEVEPPAGV